MKKMNYHIKNFFLAASVLFALTSSIAQTSKDTVKAGHSSDAMIVNPGRANDGMAVKPGRSHDGMSILSDTAFLSKNIMDNRMEIRLAQLGQTKGTSPAVKRVAALMITDHSAILNDLLKIAAATRGNAEDDHSEITMPALPEGKDFDSEWAGQMLLMHETKIAELETFIGLTKNAALKALVVKAIPKIKTHRELLLKIPGAKEKSKIVNTV
jgi:putative membrane protein